MAPIGTIGIGDADGGFNQRGVDHYARRARGGVGLIVTGVTYIENTVEQHKMPNSVCSTYNPSHFVRTSRELTERVHAYDAKIFLQISAGFGRVAAESLGDTPPIGPSAVSHCWLDKTCREISVEEIRSIVKNCGEGALYAKHAGFDGVQIHAVHEGYLLDQFAMTLFNHRTDEYGGSLDNRLRFTREIIEEIKERCGDDFPVTMRYSLKSFIKSPGDGALPGEEFVEKGRDIEEGIEVAKLLEKYGYDALDVDVGCYDAWWWSHPPLYMEKGLYRPFAKIVKESVGIPIICAGRMDDPDMALESLRSGECDMIGIGRPLLADPDYVKKVMVGKTQTIRPCLSCHEGCMGRLLESSTINCAVNPQACRERVTRLVPALKSKKVLVIGGGVAGCEAARVLKLRGHEPVLYEKSGRLGGNLIPGGVPGFKKDDHALIRWYETVLNDIGVEIHLNSEADAQLAKSGYDAVIVAAGAVPKTIKLDGGEPAFTAADVLNGSKIPEGKTVIIGGGLVGCELALWLAGKGNEVTIVEIEQDLLSTGGPLYKANHDLLKALINYKGIDVICGVQAKEYKNGLLTLTNGETRVADSVILAVGYTENDSIYNELVHQVDEIYLLGDARKVSNIMYAIWDAFEVASDM